MEWFPCQSFFEVHIKRANIVHTAVCSVSSCALSAVWQSLKLEISCSKSRAYLYATQVASLC